VTGALASRTRNLPALPVGHLAEAGLLLAVVLIFVQRTPDLPVVREAVTLSEVAFGLAACAWLGMVAVLRPPIRVYSAGLILPFLFYIFAGLLSLFFSPYDTHDINGLRELLARVYLMVFLLVLASYGVSQVSYHRILRAWGVATVLVVGLLALDLIGIRPIDVRDFEDRFIGLFRNPNAAGGALSATLLCFLPVACSRGPAAGLEQFRTLTRFTLPGLLIGVYLTDSQGAYLAVLAGLAIWPIIRVARHWGPAFPILVMVLAVPMIVAVSQVDAVGQFVEQVLGAIGYEAGGRKFSARLDMIGSRFRAIMQHPWTGVGLSKAPLSHDPLSFVAPHGSHFTILGITLETGVLGLAAVGIIFMTYLGILRSNARLPLDSYPTWRGLNEGLTMAFVGFIIFGLTHDVQTSRAMWLVASLGVCFLPAFESAARQAQPLPYRPSRLVRVFGPRAAQP
jgi:hypothetical protein